MKYQQSDIVVHIPHASTRIRLPGYTHAQLFDRSPEDIRDELSACTDWFTDDLFRGLGAPVRFPWSRLLVDVERFVDDEREPMAARGRGVIYLCDRRGKRLREFPNGGLRERLIGLYHAHHAKLQAAVDAALDAHGRCLIIDAHSFPTECWPIEPTYRGESYVKRPDFCIGTDAFHTPHRLASLAQQLIDTRGFDVALNTPYAGTLVPLMHLGETPCVHSIMIEVKRSLYLDEMTGQKIIGYDELRKCLNGIVRQLIDDWRDLTSFSCREVVDNWIGRGK